MNFLVKENQARMKMIIAITLGVAVTILYPYIFRIEGVGYSYSFFSVLLAISNIGILYHILKTTSFLDKGAVLYAGFVSLIGTLTLLWGKQLEVEESISVTDWKLWIVGTILLPYFTLLIIKGFSIMDQYKFDALKEPIGHKKVWWQSHGFVWTGIMLCWIPVFLALYPGAFVYDAQEEYLQVATREFTTQHSLVHVLLLGGMVAFFYKLFESYNLGIAVYTMMQMMVVAGCFTYMFYFLKKYQVPKIWRGITFVWVSIFPVIPMYAVCSTKDVYFTAGLLVVCLLLLEYELDHEIFVEKSYQIAFILASMVVMLLRNNGVYAYIALFIMNFLKYLWGKYKKNDEGKRRRILLLLMMIAYIGYVLITNLLILVLQADNENKEQQILTVPVQQIARVYSYNPEEFSEVEKLILYEVLSEEALQTYDPNISDILKSQFQGEVYSANPKKYQELWLQIGIRNPMTYLNAWLLTSYGFWYPDATNNVYGGITRHTYQYEESSYFGFETEPPGHRDSRLPWLEEFYRKISLEIYQQKVPVISMLFSQGFLFYIYFFIFLYILKVKQYEKLNYLLLILLLFGSVLPGPTYLPRYVLIFWFALPVTVVLPFLKNGGLL